MAPALCAPARVARAMASDFHANLNVAAVVVSGTLTACGSTPLAVWGPLPKRRGNAGSDSELPYHLNTFIEARWDCVFASTLALALTLTLTLTLTLCLCLCATYPTVPPHARTRISCPLTSLTLSPILPLPHLLRLRLRFLLLFVLSYSSVYLFPLLLHFRFFFLLFFSCYFFFSFVSALANPCWHKPRWLPAQLLEGVDIGSRTKDLSSNVAWCCVVLRRWEWSSPAFQFHDVLSFQL